MNATHFSVQWTHVNATHFSVQWTHVNATHFSVQWTHVNATHFSAMQAKQTLRRKSLGCKDANITLLKRALMQVRLRSNHFSASKTCMNTLN